MHIQAGFFSYAAIATYLAAITLLAFAGCELTFSPEILGATLLVLLILDGLAPPRYTRM